MKNMKKWLCMLLILSIIGGYGILGDNGVPDDDPKDWHKTAENWDRDMEQNV